ncbi:hypothetical protein PMAC_003095 [Pneumocystis sp. 'macacae']|nr:hypothetical protein PMAC_003095 [Pneumocystis sp. 'macacae']
MEKNLHQIFTATLSSDPNIRKDAELQLKQYSMVPGFITAILDVITTNDDISIKQAASIYLKNRIGNGWERNDSDSKILEDDKHLFRKRLLPTLLLVPPIIYSQIASIVGVILSHDFPEKWSDFMDQVVRLLNSQDAHYVYIGLISFLEISKVYRYRSGVRRQPFDVVVQTVYPRLLEIGDRVTCENDSIAGEMLKIIFKSYKFYITLELSSFVQDSIVQWVTLFLRAIIKDLSIDIVTNNLEEREHNSWWKAKKWAYSNLNCLFMRYGEPSKLFKDTLKKYKIFAKMFSENFVPEILKVYLQQVELWSDGKIWISQRCLCSLSIFFEECVFPKSTWTLLKGKCSYLISRFIFPLLCITNNDIELWNNDPVEYIHKNTDIYDNFHSPAVSATSFFIALVDSRKKSTFMEILGFINDILNTYQQTQFEERNTKEKEGALRMIGSMSHAILAKNSPIVDRMEDFFNIARAYEGIITCFHDPELPVRLEAACALQPMIQYEYVRKMVVSRIPQIMQQLLDLINELDIDTLTTVMEKFVETFSQELIPFSVQLTEQLRDTFLRIMHESDTYIEQNSELAESSYIGDKSMILMGILNTVATLILNLEKAPEVLLYITNIISPAIIIVLETDFSDLYAEIFEIINNCIFSVKKVSPVMWNIYELLYRTFENSGIDYIDEIFPVLDNYIFKADELTTQDRIHGCKLIESVFFNLKGHVDHYLHSFVKMAMNQLIKVIVSAIYYNSLITLQYLESSGWIEQFFNFWFSDIDRFSRVYDKKLSIIAICSFLSLSMNQIPKCIQKELSWLFREQLKLFQTLPQAIENRETMERFFQDNSEELSKNENWNDDTDDLAVDDDADKDIEKNRDYLNSLSQEDWLTLATNDDNYSLEEEPYNTLLDKIDVYIMFKDLMDGMQKYNQAMYNEVTKDLSQEHYLIIQTIINQAYASNAELK